MTNHPTIIASSFAIAILSVFLLRFYRCYVRPSIRGGSGAQTIFGASIIALSVVSSALLRAYGF